MVGSPGEEKMCVTGTAIASLVIRFWAETQKQYNAFDWCWKIQVRNKLKGLHRLDMNDFLIIFFLFVVINIVDYF